MTPLIPNSTPQLLDQVFHLNWAKDDFEQRLGFRGGRFTGTNKLLSFLMAVFLTVIFFVGIALTAHFVRNTGWITDMFLNRKGMEYANYPTMFFFFWGISILFIKGRKINFQQRALELAAVPQLPDFELTPATAKAVLDRVHELVDNPSHFLLLNRIERALSNLKNLGQVGDVTSILKMQSDNDDEQIASSYSLINGFIWAVPVLGFIGTVLGLSASISFFGTSLKAGGDLVAIKDSLTGVTGGLATAFETTLIALVNALILQLMTTFMQAKEGEFMDACNDYCHKNVASKLRLGSA